MKKLLSIFVIGLIIISTGLQIITKADNDNNIQLISEYIDLSDPIFIKNYDYISIFINEADSYLIEKGKPLLPAIKKTFIFPLGTKIIDVNINCNIVSYELPALIEISPNILPINYCKSVKEDEKLLDRTIYFTDGLYPNQPYFIKKSAGLYNNEHVLFCTVQIAPQYNAYENIIFIPDKIDIKIEYKSDLKPVFVNDEYDMVVIAPEKFIDTLQPLITHKNDYGINTLLKTTEEIYSTYAGVDQQEQIKYFIKDAIEQYGIEYVLLIGDVKHIPIRKTALSWEYFGELVVPDVITDLYYSDIYDENGSFSSWDSNEDGIFSEIYMIMNSQPYNETLVVIDEIDGNPDVKIGRLPCSNLRDVRNVVNKIITYETNTYEKDWFNRLILMGGDTFPNVGNINEGEVVTEYISSIMPDFTPIKLWTSLDTFRPLNINLKISKGAGFVSYSGHGFEQGIATYDPDSDVLTRYNILYIFGILNRQKYPIMYFDACLTASLDYQMLNINVPCFAWSFVKKHFGGAVASIGSTRVGFGGFGGDPFIAGTSCMHRYFYEAYETGTYLGNMFIKAQQDYIEKVINTVIYDPLTTQEFTLLGDPSLKVGGYNN